MVRHWRRRQPRDTVWIMAGVVRDGAEAAVLSRFVGVLPVPLLLHPNDLLMTAPNEIPEHNDGLIKRLSTEENDTGPAASTCRDSELPCTR